MIKTHGVGGDPERSFRRSVTDGNTAAWKRLHAASTTGPKDNEWHFALQGRHPDGSPDSHREVLLDATNLIDYQLLIFYSGNCDVPVTKFFGNADVNNF